jgi:hypothetical protein
MNSIVGIINSFEKDNKSIIAHVNSADFNNSINCVYIMYVILLLLDILAKRLFTELLTHAMILRALINTYKLPNQSYLLLFEFI